MEVIIAPTSNEVSSLAAAAVAVLVRSQPDAVLGFATDSTPLGVYGALAKMVSDREVDFSAVSGFALDEYVGIAASSPQSYRSTLLREVANPLNIDPVKLSVPDGEADDLEAACRQYEATIAAVGGIDLQLLGIGSNGHIGFNEPTSSLSSRTRVKTLSAETPADNARFFEDPQDVPRHCITQ